MHLLLITLDIYLPHQQQGDMIHPAELCTKTGERVMAVMRTKQPDACLQTMASLETYPDRAPELNPVEITNETVTEVAR